MSDNIIDRSNVININVGILGHVDSGKTSIVKALSTSLSTAALDKNPQSQQRGITLDLGFSAFTLPMPLHLKETAGSGYDQLQFTLVDCPGHASLIRTIIGGAQIIDMMLLVIDINKGIQAQTAECIVIGEITTDKLIIVLNKIDSIPEDERAMTIELVSTRIRRVFAATKFANAPIVATAAAVGGEKVASVGALYANNAASNRGGGSSILAEKTGVPSFGIEALVDAIGRSIDIPQRNLSSPFYFAIDHCFAIKGHGTVLTGTVLSGSITTSSTIELPELQQQKKVKSMQMFRKPVRTAGQGDRVGICVSSLDSDLIERGIASAPGSVPLLSSVICMVKKVRFFKHPCHSNAKFHVSIGHKTVVATAVFYGAQELESMLGGLGLRRAAQQQQQLYDESDTNVEGAPNPFQYDIFSGGGGILSGAGGGGGSKSGKGDITSLQRQSALNGNYHSNFPRMSYMWDTDFKYQDELLGDESSAYGTEPVQWALLTFQQPVYCPLGSLVIGSRLDFDPSSSFSPSGGGVSGSDDDSNINIMHQGAGTAAAAGLPGKGVNTQHCRLAFYGPIKEAITEADLEKIRVFTWKQKEGRVGRLNDVRGGLCFELIGCKLIAETSSIHSFIGMKIETEKGEFGVITGAFGSDGSFKVRFQQGIRISVGSRLVLRFKRFLHDHLKKMNQNGVGVAPPPPAVLSISSLNLQSSSDESAGKHQQQLKNGFISSLSEKSVSSTGTSIGGGGSASNNSGGSGTTSIDSSTGSVVGEAAPAAPIRKEVGRGISGVILPKQQLAINTTNGGASGSRGREEPPTSSSPSSSFVGQGSNPLTNAAVALAAAALPGGGGRSSSLTSSPLVVGAVGSGAGVVSGATTSVGGGLNKKSSPSLTPVGYGSGSSLSPSSPQYTPQRIALPPSLGGGGGMLSRGGGGLPPPGGGAAVVPQQQQQRLATSNGDGRRGADGLIGGSSQQYQQQQSSSSSFGVSSSSSNGAAAGSINNMSRTPPPPLLPFVYGATAATAAATFTTGGEGAGNSNNSSSSTSSTPRTPPSVPSPGGYPPAAAGSNLVSPRSVSSSGVSSSSAAGVYRKSTAPVLAATGTTLTPPPLPLPLPPSSTGGTINSSTSPKQQHQGEIKSVVSSEASSTTTTRLSYFPAGSTIRMGKIDSIKPEEGSTTNAVIVIVEGAFRMEENIRAHVGAKAKGPAGESGELLGPFAKMGKCKVRFDGAATAAAGAEPGAPVGASFSGKVGAEIEILLAAAPSSSPPFD